MVVVAAAVEVVVVALSVKNSWNLVRDVKHSLRELCMPSSVSVCPQISFYAR